MVVQVIVVVVAFAPQHVKVPRYLWGVAMAKQERVGDEMCVACCFFGHVGTTLRVCRLIKFANQFGEREDNESKGLR